MGMDSFILNSLNMFPELVLSLLAVCKNGDMIKANDMQEKLSSAVIAIMKHGRYHFISDNALLLKLITRFFIADNRIQAIKIAMALLTDIDTGPSRAPPKSISSETVATVTKDLMNLGYQPNIKL